VEVKGIDDTPFGDHAIEYTAGRQLRMEGA